MAPLRLKEGNSSRLAVRITYQKKKKKKKKNLKRFNGSWARVLSESSNLNGSRLVLLLPNCMARCGGI